ncbi:ketopantoate reductase family protein [Geomicrobium sp. JCM 19038]|uniref:ketopantoate reductase family protein n=1 Tax=Geomicrobium sp. JCM 19038 TaxID=1460635 RepID=UPI00045F29F7|nr:ketopantoate reductase family protein [Geomicrobium sp. JCM 19038]GAK07688.1 2-dehydropantoate 2-reductase [Geomicrobium sp. JCM 19038]
MSTIAMIGIGAVGAVYANLLNQDEVTQLYCVMDEKRKERYVSEGMNVNGNEINLNYVTPSEVNEGVDYVIFAVKNTQLDAAMDLVEPIVDDRTTFLSLLNGIDSERQLSKRFGEDRVLYGLTNGIDATKNNQEVFYTYPGTLYFGEKQNEQITERVHQLQAVFERAQIPSFVPVDMERQLWHKFMVNVGVNAVTAISRSTHGVLRDSEELLNVSKRAMNEVIKVANANNIALTESMIDEFFENVWTKVGYSGKTSMLQDIEAKRKSENDYFAKRVIEMAQKHGISVPVNETLYAFVHHEEKRF